MEIYDNPSVFSVIALQQENSEIFPSDMHAFQFHSTQPVRQLLRELLGPKSFKNGKLKYIFYVQLCSTKKLFQNLNLKQDPSPFLSLFFF